MECQKNRTCYLGHGHEGQCMNALGNVVASPAPLPSAALEALLKEADEYQHTSPVGRQSVGLVAALASALRQLLSDQSATDKEPIRRAVETEPSTESDQRDHDRAAAWQSLLKSVVLSHDSADDFESLMALAVARRALGFKLVDDDEEVLLANGYDVQAELDAVFTPRGDGASR